MGGLSDMMDREEDGRKVDEALSEQEKNMEYCNHCEKWVSRYLPHLCEGREEGKDEK